MATSRREKHLSARAPASADRARQVAASLRGADISPVRTVNRMQEAATVEPIKLTHVSIPRRLMRCIPTGVQRARSRVQAGPSGSRDREAIKVVPSLSERT